MISFEDYLQLLPKTELHCHFTSTMTAGHFLRMAERQGVDLPRRDPGTLFDFADLSEFLVTFRAAHDLLRDPQDLAQVAYDGVRAAVADGSLRYREYHVNPQYFARRGVGYAQLLDPVVDGLRAAETDLGVGFGIVVAIDRRSGADSALQLVEQVVENPRPEVVGLGMDDLTPEGTEDPLRFAAAYDLARRHGLKLTAHVGETGSASAADVAAAVDVLRCDRLDHGYRVVDDPELTRRVRDLGIPFATTPTSTTFCSGWTLDDEHPIARMIEAGLRVTVSTDDAVFFGTDIGREYRDGLRFLGVDAAGARAVALAGVDAAFCDESTKAGLRARFTAEIAALDRLHLGAATEERPGG